MSGAMGWIGAITGLLGGLGNVYENGKLAGAEAGAGKAALGTGFDLSKSLADWSGSDYNSITKMLGESNPALVARLNKGPDYGLQEARSVSPITQQASHDMATAHRAGQVSDAAAASTGSGGLARAAARTDADTAHWSDMAKAAGAFSGSEGTANKLMTGSIDSTYNLADKIGGRASQQSQNVTNALGGLGKEAGNALSYAQWNSSGNNNNAQNGNTAEYRAAGGQVPTQGQNTNGTYTIGTNTYANKNDANSIPQWKNGGLVRALSGGSGQVSGPGTGRSDSIPAVVDNQQPAAISTGEYIIKARTARRIGIQRLQKIIAMHDGMHGGPRGNTRPAFGLTAAQV